MIIDCISDLHGFYPELEGGDLLIVAGDLTARHTKEEFIQFIDWIHLQKYREKIVIGGNHDGLLQENECFFQENRIDEYIDLEYLCDSGTEFEGLKIWGSPWTSQFPGINPKCCAFTRPFMKSLKDRWDLIPDDTDILITHGPPNGMMDKVSTDYNASVGDMDLALAVTKRIRPKLHVFGHIHEGYGMSRPNLGFVDLDGYPIFVNASHVNEYYEPVNKPIRIEL